jgi:RNA polymerase sigma-70 factor, ECF subfamily
MIGGERKPVRISGATRAGDGNALIFASEAQTLKDKESEEWQDAETDSFYAVFTRYSKPVLMFIYSLVGDRGRAEELTQETFVRACRKMHTVRESEHLSTWLFGIARNVVREAIKEKYRRERRLTALEPVSFGLSDSGAGADERLITHELRQRIQAALLTLPDDQRIVFVLKLINELPYEEISGVTGASVGKLKTDLHRARLKMREELRQYIEKEISGKRGAL